MKAILPLLVLGLLATETVYTRILTDTDIAREAPAAPTSASPTATPVLVEAPAVNTPPPPTTPTANPPKKAPDPELFPTPKP
ncbi:MAG: hypothetical protein Q7T03_02615 [Deltaproteobacteria bacterium]|nr:hypothetical protein [Deltaproteobacteria bacterium]